MEEGFEHESHQIWIKIIRNSVSENLVEAPKNNKIVLSD